MRQQALRASKTCGSHKVSFVAVRHNTRSRSFKKTRASSTDGQRSVLQKTPLPKPLPFLTNRRDLFNWSRWDGRLWKTTALWAYHKSKFFHITKRTQDSLRFAQTHLIKRPAPRSDFWYKHYADAHIANHSMHSFYLLIIETSAIKFILKTSPTKIHKRLYRTVSALDSCSYQLSLHVHQLYNLRSIWAHRTHNPLYFKAAIDRLRRTAVGRHNVAKDRVFDKNVRTHRKLAFGQDWKIHSSKFRYAQSKDQSNHWQESFVMACDACPQRWTIEPALYMVASLISRLYSCCSAIEDFTNADRQTLSTSAFEQVRNLLRAMSVCSWDLSLLVQELAALRYYRLHHFPCGFRNEEIQLWRQFWLRTALVTDVQAAEGKGGDGQSADTKTGKTLVTWLPEVQKTRALGEELRAVSSKPFQDMRGPGNEEDGLDKDLGSMTLKPSHPDLLASRAKNVRNSQGQVSWTRWDGQTWDTRATVAYKQNLVVLNATEARANMMTLQRHASEHLPYEVDTLRMSHYRSQWKVNLGLQPLLKLMVNLSAITFLLRTAPDGIRDRLFRHVQVIEILGYDLGLDLEVLRGLQTTLAHLPESPLLFLEHAMRIKTSNASRLFESQTLLAAKWHRSNAKAVSGTFVSNKSKKSKLLLHGKELKRQGNMRSKLRIAESWTWQLEYPFAIVAPFRGTIHSIMSRFRKVLQSFMPMKSLYLRNFPTRTWGRVISTIHQAYVCPGQVISLASDLAVLRYYRLEHYPESVSEKVLRLDRALATAIGSIRLASERKVPERSQRGVSGQSRSPVKRGPGDRRTSRESRSSERRSKPQAFLVEKEAGSRTRVLSSQGIDEWNHQLGPHRVLKASTKGQQHAQKRHQTGIRCSSTKSKKSGSRSKYGSVLVDTKGEKKEESVTR